MSDLHQIQMTFMPLEDRLLCRINTSDDNEYKLWITRRYVKLLWKVLLEMLENTQEKHISTFKKSSLLSFEHEEAIQKSDFASKYQEGKTNPLGDTPTLVSEITLKKRPDKSQILCMHPKQGYGLELALNAQMLHSIAKLVIDAVNVAEWDLNLRLDPIGTAYNSKTLN